ncbi:MAG TPA: hypothetical protein VJK06_04535 [Methyloceanibacter sp.]|nr:hypothetical protein [Methyloceanibacter sp.]
MTTIFTNTTASSDQTPASGIPYIYGANDITLTINPGIAVISRDNFGVSSSLSGSQLANSGNIVSAAASAVAFEGSNGSITNFFTGHISGVNGIRLNGTMLDVHNFGSISGFAGAGVYLDTSAAAIALYNDGDIYGRGAGVFSAIAGQAAFENRGAVRSDSNGIEVVSGSLTILNEGFIVSNFGESIRTTGSGSIFLTNKGTLQGDINCLSGGNDAIVNLGGEIKGDVFLGDGSDTFNGTGGSVSGPVHGGGGEDTLIAGIDPDELWGDGDLDMFKFVKVKEIGKGQDRDVIMDFGDVVGEKIDLDAIDAKKGPGNQDFKFIGGQKFHHKAGELHMLNKSGFVVVEGDVNGDGKADFQLEVHGLGLPDKGDFLGVL